MVYLRSNSYSFFFYFLLESRREFPVSERVLQHKGFQDERYEDTEKETR
jgi:hypothetical protein